MKQALLFLTVLLSLAGCASDGAPREHDQEETYISTGSYIPRKARNDVKLADKEEMERTIQNGTSIGGRQ